MLGSEQYAVYRTVIKHVLSDSERLPSLPTITLKIRKAVGQSNTTAASLAQLVGKDPALTALLIKSASCPLFRRPVAPKTLTEVGSLAVLSALIESNQAPDPETYFQLCRHYSKSLGSVLLHKWNVDQGFVTVLKQSGDWSQTTGDDIALIDIVNLSVYNTALLTNKNANLPPLESLAAFGKLSESERRCSKPNRLALVTENMEEIQTIVDTFR